MKPRPTGLNWDAIKAPEPTEPKPKRQGRKIPITEEQIAEAVAEYVAGVHSYDIARAFDVSHMTVIKWVRAAGQKVRTPHESRRLDRENRRGESR